MIRWELVKDARIWLVGGNVVLAVGIINAYLTPATRYEPSIYTGTPLVFWISVLFGLLVSTIVVFHLDGRLCNCGLALAGLSMISVVALPLIRGYHYLGENDALTHLGYARELNTEIIAMNELQYPAVHFLGSVLKDIINIELTHSLLIVLITCVFVYFVFIPLTVRRITSEKLVVVSGVFAGFLLLPINHISGHMQIHTTSQAVMFIPVVLYLFVAYYRAETGVFFGPLLIAASTLLLLHPQQGVHILFFFGIMLFFHLIFRLLKPWFTISEDPKIHYFTFIFAFAFWLWAGSGTGIESIIQSLVTNLILDPGAVGTDVASRGLSLQELGGSYEEIFIKLFLIPLLFCALSAIIMAAAFFKNTCTDRADRLWSLFVTNNRSEKETILYISVGFLPLVGFFFAYLIADMAQFYFRTYATMMPIITILGAIVIGRTFQLFNRFVSVPKSHFLITIIIFIIILVSVPVIYSSPYIYETSGHTTEAQMNGFDTAFQHESEEISFSNVRSSPSRYGSGLYGPSARDRADYYREGERSGNVPNRFADQALHDYFDNPSYLTITEADRVRDPVIWQGFRYSHEDFEYLDRDEHINKIQSNGGFDLYFVDPK